MGIFALTEHRLHVQYRGWERAERCQRCGRRKVQHTPTLPYNAAVVELRRHHDATTGYVGLIDIILQWCCTFNQVNNCSRTRPSRTRGVTRPSTGPTSGPRNTDGRAPVYDADAVIAGEANKRPNPKVAYLELAQLWQPML